MWFPVFSSKHTQISLVNEIYFLSHDLQRMFGRLIDIDMDLSWAAIMDRQTPCSAQISGFGQKWVPIKRICYASVVGFVGDHEERHLSLATTTLPITLLTMKNNHDDNRKKENILTVIYKISKEWDTLAIKRGIYYSSQIMSDEVVRRCQYSRRRKAGVW